MKTELYVFSGTGNGLAIARELQQQLGSDCELSSIPRRLGKNGSELLAPVIGLVFPVHFGGLPSLVRTFLNSARIAPGAYIFAVVTSGAGSAGLALSELARILRAQRAQLKAGFSLTMPTNYTLGWYYPLIRKTLLQHTGLYKRAQQQLAAIVPVIQKKATVAYRKNLVTGLVPKIINPRILFEPVATWDRDFWSNEKCNGCGTCQRACPVNNIENQDGRPAWKHHCQLCLRCVGTCPQEAIQFKQVIKKRPKYRHPGVTTQELITF
jgi:ferredoxin